MLNNKAFNQKFGMLKTKAKRTCHFVVDSNINVEHCILLSLGPYLNIVLQSGGHLQTPWLRSLKVSKREPLNGSRVIPWLATVTNLYILSIVNN